MRSPSSFSYLIVTGMIVTAIGLTPRPLAVTNPVSESQIDDPTEILISRGSYRDRGSRGTGRREIMTHRSVAFVA
ncbi:hypothetical protein [Leptolyngbya sp. PCC 6406]|uniref:hypothetical protein n=1 Tax=Leptolyngbya sp. PCC 6406 TaxID=1173264 RepID=UPI0002ACD3A4|nr:hypothetical protein [Leptolyngbya sp. PCC 6406]